MTIEPDYDAQADFFDDLMPTLTADSPEIEVYADVLGTAKTVLEFGSGTGRINYPLAENLARRNGSVSIDGFDISKRMVEVARARVEQSHPNATHSFRVVDACEELGTVFTKFGAYDAAFALCGFTSLLGRERIPAFLTNAFHSLRAGGRLLVDGINPSMVELSIPYVNGTLKQTED